MELRSFAHRLDVSSAGRHKESTKGSARGPGALELAGASLRICRQPVRRDADCGPRSNARSPPTRLRLVCPVELSQCVFAFVAGRHRDTHPLLPTLVLELNAPRK